MLELRTDSRSASSEAADDAKSASGADQQQQQQLLHHHQQQQQQHAGNQGSNSDLSVVPQLTSASSTAAPVDVTTLCNQDGLGVDSSGSASVGLHLPDASSTEEGQTNALKGHNSQRGSTEGQPTQNAQAAHHAEVNPPDDGAKPRAQLIRDDSIGLFAQAALQPFGSMEKRWTFGRFSSRTRDDSAESLGEYWLQISMRHAASLFCTT
jgi:hypothetical protein